jgi:hypothetical protein
VRNIFRTLIAIVVLVAVVYFVTNYAGQIQQQVGVKGASTSRAQEIAGNITSDVGSQVNNAKNQAMHVNISDVMSYLSRFKKVPQDASNLKDYAQSQLNNVLKSKDKK